jgi:hypothetical protein
VSRIVGLIGLVVLLLLLAFPLELPIDERLTPALHLLAGGLLAGALMSALGLRATSAALLVAVAAVALEPAQGLLTPDRRPDPLDAIGGVAGALLGALLAHRVVARHDR